MFKIIEKLSDTAFCAEEGGNRYVLKPVLPEERAVYDKLLNIKNDNFANTVGYTEIGGMPYVVREFVYGRSLDDYIEYNGNEIVMEDLIVDSVFGSNISSTNDENCQIIAKEDTEVLVIDYYKLLNPKNLRHVYFNIFFRNLFDIMSTKLKERNERIRILEKKQIREKLLEYFEIEHKKSHSRNIYLPFHFKDLADYIAVNRSAMFRELKNLKEEKFIEIKDRRITLLYK